MVEQTPKYKKNLSSLISFCILLSYISLNPILAYAENAEATTDIVQEPANITESKPNSSNTNNNIEEAFSMEALWFGFAEEVTIATRHETPVSKAPSIVTVITAEEIKNLGYRTFAEILRIIPGFELLKTGDFGTLVPAVRGITGSEKIRVMVNGHLVNSPFTDIKS